MSDFLSCAELINTLGFNQRSNMGSDFGPFYTKELDTGCFHICIKYDPEGIGPHYFDFYYYPGARSDIEVRSDYYFASANILKDNIDDIKCVIRAIADPELFALCVGIEWFQDILSAYYKIGLVNEHT